MTAAATRPMAEVLKTAAALEGLLRRPLRQEPPTLAEGRRQRIERVKAGA